MSDSWPIILVAVMIIITLVSTLITDRKFERDWKRVQEGSARLNKQLRDIAYAKMGIKPDDS